MTWRMPAETEPHERTWMAWPTGYTLGDTSEEADTARRTWAAVAHAIARFEPVSMVVTPDAVDIARKFLGTDVQLHEALTDDAWMRDSGPTFVVDESGRLGAVDWVFNGWGAQSWATWEHDAKIASTVAEWVGAEVVTSPMVNEGGGVHVDGSGTVLLTETVQLDADRNPGWTRAEVEAELARTLGVTKAIWFPRGLARDYKELGTRGHVDIVATFASPATLLVHAQRDPAHPDFEISKTVHSILSECTDAADRALELIEMPAPVTLTDAFGPVDYSYVNHLVVNGGVVACIFDDANDDKAMELLAQAYPGREIVGVDARPLFERGGGVHCITQQQPAT